jgi:hypothetical protein
MPRARTALASIIVCLAENAVGRKPLILQANETGGRTWVLAI